MPGENVTTNVTAVVSVVDKTAGGLAAITQNIEKVENAVKSINTTVPHSLEEMVKNVPGNIWNLPVRGESIVPDISAPAQIQAAKVVGVYERMRDKLGEIGGSIKQSLGGAFESVFAVARRVGASLMTIPGFAELFGAGFGVGAAIGVVVGGMNDLVASVNKMKPQADALGITIAQLQRLTEWAREGGAPVDRVASSLANLTRVTAGVAEGAKGYDRAAAAFDKLHVSLTDADTGKMKDLNQLLPELATGFQNIADPAERAKAAYDIFGQTWKVMLPLLMQGPEALAKAADASKAIGEISDAQIAAAQKYELALGQFQRTWQSTRETIGAELLPVVTPALQDLTKFLQENKGEIVAGFKVGIDGLAEAFRQLSAVVKSTNDDIQGIKAGWDWLNKPISVPEWFGGPHGGVNTGGYGGAGRTWEAPPATTGEGPSILVGTQPGQPGQAANGTVNVVIDNRNPPPGQTTNATATGNGVKVDVGQSMPWSAPEYRGPMAPAPG